MGVRKVHTQFLNIYL